ncbi:MAG: cytochrome c oxidase assembly protein [Acidimicrobiales bacterium]
MGFVLLPLLGTLYAAGVRRLAGRARRWPLGRSVAFGLGLLVLAVATLPPLAALDTDRFSVHVVQHLLLGMVAPACLALGAPVTLALQASSRARQVALLRVVHSAPIAMLTHPVVSWVVFGGSLFALYFSPVFGWSLRHEAVHDIVHVHFLLAGCAFVWPLVGLDPVRWRLPHGARLLSVLLALPFHAFVGIALLQTDRVLGDGGWSVADQRVGAGILWAAGDLLAGAAAAVIFVQWAGADDREAARIDRRLH